VQLDSDRAASSVARQVGCELRRDFLACLQRVPLAKLMSVSLPTPAYLPRIGPPLPAVDPERAMKEKTGKRKAEKEGALKLARSRGAPSSNIYENYPQCQIPRVIIVADERVTSHRKELRIIKIEYNEKSFLIKKISAYGSPDRVACIEFK
jgi:hypothetical protein